MPERAEDMESEVGPYVGVEMSQERILELAVKNEQPCGYPTSPLSRQETRELLEYIRWLENQLEAAS